MQSELLKNSRQTSLSTPKRRKNGQQTSLPAPKRRKNGWQTSLPAPKWKKNGGKLVCRLPNDARTIGKLVFQYLLDIIRWQGRAGNLYPAEPFMQGQVEPRPIHVIIEGDTKPLAEKLRIAAG